MTELTRDTAALNLDSTHELRLRQMVRVQIGAASTAATVTSIEASSMTEETRYGIRFENTTPAFTRAISEALGEATVTSLTNRTGQSQGSAHAEPNDVVTPLVLRAA